MINSLTEARIAAAMASKGTSNDAVHDALLRALADHNASGDILDFGAGQGQLSGKLGAIARFSSVTGVDIMQRPPLLRREIGWHVQDLNEPLDLADQSVDVIVAAEVIEHLENPRALARVRVTRDRERADRRIVNSRIAAS